MLGITFSPTRHIAFPLTLTNYVARMGVCSRRNCPLGMNKVLCICKERKKERIPFHRFLKWDSLTVFATLKHVCVLVFSQKWECKWNWTCEECFFTQCVLETVPLAVVHVGSTVQFEQRPGGLTPIQKQHSSESVQSVSHLTWCHLTSYCTHRVTLMPL